MVARFPEGHPCMAQMRCAGRLSTHRVFVFNATFEKRQLFFRCTLDVGDLHIKG